MANVDPVSGNEIPPGGAPEEVRDNIPIKASEGEYMLPADVVKYFGLDYIEKLITKAKAGMEELQANGRIGGSGPDDLPFSPEELQAHEEELSAEEAPAQEVPMHMAVGGFVSPLRNGVSGPVASMGITTPEQPAITPPMPPWMGDTQTKNPELQVEKEGAGRGPRAEPTGFGQSVDKWSTKDYSDYADSKTNPVRTIADKVFSSVSPLAGMAVKAATRYTDKTAIKSLDKMLESGTDPLGNPLSAEDKASLQSARERLSAQKEEASGLGGGIGGLIGKAIEGFVEKKKEKAPEAKTKEKEAPARDSSGGSNRDSRSSSQGNQSQSRERTGGRSMAKGGLVTRRK